jgi:hypothetical protein
MNAWHGTWMTLAVLLVVAVAVAQDDAEPAQPTSADTPARADAAGDDDSAEQVLNELLRRRAENPLIEPAQPDAADADPDQTARPLGTAPGVTSTKLRREGQFIVGRRARMVRADGGVTPWALTFDADKDGMQDPPMFLMPCRMLEDMEKIIADRDDEVAFMISGQVFVYRGANYLLPTLMKLAPDRGNLQP